ncbi:hypothetical protein OKW34_002999 [Paraburkholderia youngii]
MLDYAQLLGNYVELLADFYAELDQRMAVVAAETLGLRKFVPPDLAGQTGVKRLAVATFFTRMRSIPSSPGYLPGPVPHSSQALQLR